MTCIVGWVDGNTSWIGGDSAGVAGYDLHVRADQKVFKNGPMLFGFTTSFRMGQVLRYALEIPDHDPRIDDDKFLVTTFVDAVRSCLKNAGFASKDKEQEQGGQFLVAYRGRIVMVEGDYQVAVVSDGYCAVGCGAQVAMGAMYASPHLSGRARIENALQAAERFSAGVRGPFHIISSEAQ